MAASPQQREHQRCEFVAHRQTGKAHRSIVIGCAAYLETGDMLRGAIERCADHVMQRGDFLQQDAGFLRVFVITQRADQLDRFAQVREIGFKLLFESGAKHDDTP